MGALLIFAGGVLLLAIPLGWMWLLPHLGQSYALVYPLVLVGCPATMIAWAMALHAVNRRFVGFRLERQRRNEVLEASITATALLCLAVLVARG